MNLAEKYKGLTGQQVIESREKHGKNEVAPPERDPWWKMYLETFEDPIIRLLLIAIGLSILIAIYKFISEGHLELYEPIGVIIAVFLATYIGFINTWKAMKQFDVLNQINSDVPVILVRDGNITQIPKSEVVVGDIVILETGMEIPADGEIIESTSLQINESNGLSTLFCTTFIRSYLQDDILPESCIPKYCEYVYNCTIKHNFSTLYSTLLSF